MEKLERSCENDAFFGLGWMDGMVDLDGMLGLEGDGGGGGGERRQRGIYG